MTLNKLFIFVAAILFALATFGVVTSFSLVDAGLFFLAIGLLNLAFVLGPGVQ